MTKIKAQKKIVEQRQKNVALANNSSKRDRDEIDSLRKQLTQTKDEQYQKDKYHKTQTDRLNRQISDLREENQELRDEIAHYDSELREVREQQFTSKKEDVQARASNTGIGQGVFKKRGSIGSGSDTGAKKVKEMPKAEVQREQRPDSRQTLDSKQTVQRQLIKHQNSIEEFEN